MPRTPALHSIAALLACEPKHRWRAVPDSLNKAEGIWTQLAVLKAMKGARQFSPKPEAEVYRYKQLLDEHKHPFVTHHETTNRSQSRAGLKSAMSECPRSLIAEVFPL